MCTMPRVIGSLESKSMLSRTAILFCGTAAIVGCLSVGLCGVSDDDAIKAVLQAHSDPSDESGCAVVLDLSNGEISHSVSVGRASAKDAFEVGGVVMPLTACIALENGTAKIDTLFSTDCDRVKYPNLPNDGGHKWDAQMSVGDALVKSSNIIIGKVGAEVGKDALAEGLRQFGLTQFAGDCACRWAVGHGVSASIEDIARAYAVFANHGREPWGERRQIVKAEVADAVCADLEKVTTNEGTAKAAAVEGVKTAGKTATAQRMIDGVYVSNKFNAVFAGIVPSDAPRYVVVVRYETGVCRDHLGGRRPAEAFADIVRLLFK